MPAQCHVNPGTTLAAVHAMQTLDTFTRGQVAYLIALAYETGRLHGYADDLADTIGTWQEHPAPARLTRQQRIAQRLADYGPAPRYTGGPVDWETGLPVREAA